MTPAPHEPVDTSSHDASPDNAGSTLVIGATPIPTDGDMNDAMVFGLVIYSDGRGNVWQCPDVDGPSELVLLRLDDDGQSTDDVPLEPLPDGWEFLTGWTGQYGYSGMVMHSSEYVGGRLARHIRETAGYYVCLVVDGIADGVDAESEPIGWAIGFRE